MSGSVATPDGGHEQLAAGKRAHPPSVSNDEDAVTGEFVCLHPPALGDAEEEVVEGEF